MSSSPNATSQLEAMTTLGVRNEDLRQEVVRGARRRLAQRLGGGRSATSNSTATASPARSSSPTPMRSRAAPACRSAPGLGCPATWTRSSGSPARRPTTAGSPTSARTARNAAGASRWSRSPPTLDDVLAEIRRAKADGLGGGDDPGDVDVDRRRITTAATTRCGRCAKSCDCRSSPTPARPIASLRRPPRHLRHRGHLVAGAAAVVHALVGRVRPLPRLALRRHRGRLLVAAAA